MKRLYRIVLVGVLITTGWLGPWQRANALSTAALTPQEAHGKEIYGHGYSVSGRDITALMGEATLHVPATALPCVNCHGADGRGKPEGGVTPSNITWRALTKSYGLTHADGRQHPPYTEQTLGLAITQGHDPAGNPLGLAMPRYRLSEQDLAALIAYLKRLGDDRDPGVTATRITIGTMVPRQGPLASMGQAMQAVLRAYFADLNAQGGLYNRRLELQVIDSTHLATTNPEQTPTLSDARHIFAMVGALPGQAEADLTALIEHETIPFVGPSTRFPHRGYPVNRHVFTVLSGLEAQASALVDFAAQTLPNPRLRPTILYPASARLAEIAEILEARSHTVDAMNWRDTATLAYPREQFDARHVVSTLRRDDRGVIFFLGSGKDAMALAVEAERQRWKPTLFLLGPLAGRDIFHLPQPLQSRVFLTFPSLPTDFRRSGLTAYRALADKHQLSTQHLAAQLSVYCAAKILVEGIKRAGRALSREKLITALEGLYEFDTGLSPRITYGPDRRIGALGAYIVSLDLTRKRFVPVSAWITPK